MITIEAEKHIYSVSELNRTARLLLENHFNKIWVSGELSNFTTPSSGHWYFSLKDHDAQIRCVMFRGNNQSVRFKVENGQHVVAFARASLYEDRGDFQLIIEALELEGDGLLQQEFNRLKEKLFKAGLFNEVHKKPLPQFPQNIGVITSPTGAAIRDILTTLQRRFRFATVIIYPTEVQGKQAAPALQQALATAIARHECDVLILARGGGSLEDLFGFNDEALARLIFESPIPIVTGIGHEIDITIADFVADKHAATPTAAAELASPDGQALFLQFEFFAEHLFKAVQKIMRHLQHTLHHLQKRLQDPKRQLQLQTERLDNMELCLIKAIKHRLASHKIQLAHLQQTLHQINPYRVLERGYAIVKDEHGAVVKSVIGAQKEEVLTIVLKDGKVTTTVKDTIIDEK